MPMAAEDSLYHHINVADTATATTDSAHVYTWQWETLPQVSGMYLRDSLPQIKLNGFHEKIMWKGRFTDYVEYSGHYHSELPPNRPGEQGVPVEYSVSNDSFLSMGIFFCILLTILMVARSIHFVGFQAKNFFRTPREDSAIMRETSSEMRYQAYFSIQGTMLLGIFAYTLASRGLKSGEDFSMSPYGMIGIYVTLFLLYRGLCELLEAIVLPLHTTESQRMIWAGARLFLIAVQGVLLLPLALLYLYFHLNIETAAMICATIIGTTVILRYYKAWRVLFQKNSGALTFLLYLVTLKIVPMALLAEALLFVSEYLKINI